MGRRTDDTPGLCDPERHALGERLLAEGRAEMARLRVLKGSTPRRRARRTLRGSATAPAFASPSTNSFGLADVGSRSSPHLADIDGDGDLDALVGETGGNTIFFANTGSASAPAFASPSTNPFGLVDVGNYSSPHLADIDGDGDLDAFVGVFNGDTIFFSNSGNLVPTAIALSKTTVRENKPVGTTVGTFSATDPGDTLTFSLVAGPGSKDNAAFTISGRKLKTAESFDFEDDATKKIRVRVTDSAGGTFEKAFTINVTDVAARLRVNDVSKAEGDKGKKGFTFTIKRTKDTSGPVSVLVASKNGTARSGSDYQALDKTPVDFADGERRKKVKVFVNGDTKAEPNETFTLVLSRPKSAVIPDGEGVGTIENDD